MECRVDFSCITPGQTLERSSYNALMPPKTSKNIEIGVTGARVKTVGHNYGRTIIVPGKVGVRTVNHKNIIVTFMWGGVI